MSDPIGATGYATYPLSMCNFVWVELGSLKARHIVKTLATLAENADCEKKSIALLNGPRLMKHAGVSMFNTARFVDLVAMSGYLPLTERLRAIG